MNRIALYLLFTFACSSAAVDKPTQARVGYEAQLANCVAQAKARHPGDTASERLAGRIDSDDCSDNVKRQWAAKDGGQ